MPPKRSSGSSSSKPQSKKKKQADQKSQRTITNLFGTEGSVDSEVTALTKLHEGKRLLILASGVYSSESDIPAAETNYLFVYSFRKINPDGKKATIDFEGKYIEDGGSQWVNYTDTAAEDADIDSQLINYDYNKHLNEDHERYNSYLGKINKARNDELEEEQAKLKEAARAEPDNTQAIVDQFAQRTEEPKERCYQILLNEFEPDRWAARKS